MAITVDSALSDSSTNPVENRAITNALNGKADTSSLPHGVPSGGTTGQVLVKSSNSDYAVEWQTVTTPSGTKNISITSNGTTSEDVTNYATASIITNVPASAVVSGTLNVDSSGTKDVTNYQYASVPAGTAGTPTATKGTVSNHSVTVTPSVTNSAGWVGSETKTGTAVTVQASELVSGTKSITQNGTGIDVTEYAAVDVSVSGGYTADEIAFGGMTGAVTVNGSSRIKTYAFYNQTGITSFSAPNTEGFDSYAFQNCSSCTTFYFPNATYMYAARAFAGCSSVQLLCFPKGGTYPYKTYLYNTTFENCSNLETIDLNVVTGLGNGSFTNCAKLTTIILRHTSVVTIGNTATFNGTPFASGGTGGTIYIPQSLYNALGTGTNDYKAASNWSTIDGYGTITWAKIEGSYYETHYADGTLIPT